MRLGAPRGRDLQSEEKKNFTCQGQFLLTMLLLCVILGAISTLESDPVHVMRFGLR
jgi:hypothetical protein